VAVDPQSVRDALARPLSEDQAIEDGSIDAKLSTAKITLISPLTDDSDLEIVRGDSYNSTRGRAFTFPLGASPNLTDAVVKWRAKRKNLSSSPYTMEITCNVTGAGTSSQTIVLELDSETTSALEVTRGQPNYLWDLQASWNNQDPATLIRGTMRVLEDVAGVS
jgi:hypothetical protein